MLPDAITLHLNIKSHEINVVFDNLVVTGVQIGGGRVAELSGLMNYFKKKDMLSTLPVARMEK